MTIVVLVCNDYEDQSLAIGEGKEVMVEEEGGMREKEVRCALR